MKEEFGSASGKGIERTLNTVLPLKALRTAVLASHGSGQPGQQGEVTIKKQTAHSESNVKRPQWKPGQRERRQAAQKHHLFVSTKGHFSSVLECSHGKLQKPAGGSTVPWWREKGKAELKTATATLSKYAMWRTDLDAGSKENSTACALRQTELKARVRSETQRQLFINLVFSC